jgi:hypothetical protein
MPQQLHGTRRHRKQIGEAVRCARGGAAVCAAAGPLHLVRAHGRKLLLLQHLHQALLQHLAHQHLQDGLHLKVKVKQVACGAVEGRARARWAGPL